MLARIERCLYALIAMLALWAVVVAVTPAAAQAQQTAPAKNTKDTNIVVSPGDSLWSISSERLGPNATPQQIAIGVERIYTLNQNRIGGDPNLLLVGQKLSLPPMGEEPSRTARGAAKPAGAAEASKRDPRPEKVSRVSKASRTPSDTQAKPVGLPDMPHQQAAPKVGSPTVADTTSSPLESFVSTARSLLFSATSAISGLFAQGDRPDGDRKVLGLGIIALTLLIAGLIAWKLPLKRNAAGGFEAWIPSGFPSRGYTGYAGGYTPDSRSTGGEAPALENGLNGSAETIVAARRRRERVLHEQERSSSRSPRRGLATGAHNPQVRRHLRRARTSTPRSPQPAARGFTHSLSPRKEDDHDGCRGSLLRGASRTDPAAGAIAGKEVGRHEL